MRKIGEQLFVIGSVALVFLAALIFLLNFDAQTPVNAYVIQADNCAQISQALETEAFQLQFLQKQLESQKKNLEEFEKQNAQYLK